MSFHCFSFPVTHFLYLLSLSNLDSKLSITLKVRTIFSSQSSQMCSWDQTLTTKGKLPRGNQLYLHVVHAAWDSFREQELKHWTFNRGAADCGEMTQGKAAPVFQRWRASEANVGESPWYHCRVAPRINEIVHHPLG